MHSAEEGVLYVVGEPKKYKREGVFRLGDLPFELRQRIYYFALPRSLMKASTLANDRFPDKSLTYPRLFSAWLSQPPSLSLLRVSSQVSDEATDAFFTNNTFDVWVPFVHEGEIELWLLPPLQNSWKGFPEFTMGRWYARIAHKHWRAMRKVNVIFGGSGWVRSGAARYNWHVIGRRGGSVEPEAPEEVEAESHRGGVEGLECACNEFNDDKRAENFDLLCSILYVRPGREKALSHFELTFLSSHNQCDKAADVSNIQRVQEIVCERLRIQAGARIAGVVEPWRHYTAPPQVIE